MTGDDIDTTNKNKVTHGYNVEDTETTASGNDFPAKRYNTESSVLASTSHSKPAKNTVLQAELTGSFKVGFRNVPIDSKETNEKSAFENIIMKTFTKKNPCEKKYPCIH